MAESKECAPTPGNLSAKNCTHAESAGTVICKMCKINPTVTIRSNDTKFCEPCWRIQIINSKNESCPICFSDLTDIRTTITPVCNHAFCYQCFLGWSSHHWAKTGNFNVGCPMCRTINKL